MGPDWQWGVKHSGGAVGAVEAARVGAGAVVKCQCVIIPVTRVGVGSHGLSDTRGPRLEFADLSTGEDIVEQWVRVAAEAEESVGMVQWSAVTVGV